MVPFAHITMAVIESPLQVNRLVDDILGDVYKWSTQSTDVDFLFWI